jgi:hypothetical protein
MDIAALISRANRLWVFQSDEITKTMQQMRENIIRDHAARGMLGSGNLIGSLASIQKDNLSNAVGMAWETLKETHGAMGGNTALETRLAMKAWMNETIGKLKGRASAEIAQDLSRFGAQLLNKHMLGQFDNTETIAHSLNSRYEAIIDNHLDHLTNNPMACAPVTINAQNIGAVLTGERAKAHIVQNVGAVKEMRELVGLMREVLKHDAGLDQQRRAELIEIADDTRVELDKPSPNETKLMTLFTLLTQSVQTLPAAKPAYDAAKALLAMVGVSLP